MELSSKRHLSPSHAPATMSVIITLTTLSVLEESEVTEDLPEHMDVLLASTLVEPLPRSGFSKSTTTPWTKKTTSCTSCPSSTMISPGSARTQVCAFASAATKGRGASLNNGNCVTQTHKSSRDKSCCTDGDNFCISFVGRVRTLRSRKCDRRLFATRVCTSQGMLRNRMKLSTSLTSRSPSSSMMVRRAWETLEITKPKNTEPMSIIIVA
mmetsp:Transcript_29788/g.81705  ORF Transcript_29788/g.81705 Transcript_29788/m.81705 type:complete len:211 (-) Transcript_29788:1777-2409(-)